MKTVGTTLFHRLLLPERSSSAQHPTVIMLHGRGADEEDLFGLAPMLDEQLMVISVRAPFPFDYGGGFTWYEIDQANTPEPKMFLSSYELLTQFVRDVLAHYPVDPNNLFLLGFSMGTMMAFSLALTEPGLFRGVIANSGYVPEKSGLNFKWNQLSGVHFFIAHGMFDPVIPIAFGKRTRDLFSASNASWTYKEYPMAHEISQESLSDASVWLKRIIDPGKGASSV